MTERGNLRSDLCIPYPNNTERAQDAVDRLQQALLESPEITLPLLSNPWFTLVGARYNILKPQISEIIATIHEVLDESYDGSGLRFDGATNDVILQNHAINTLQRQLLRLRPTDPAIRYHRRAIGVACPAQWARYFLFRNPPEN